MLFLLLTGVVVDAVFRKLQATAMRDLLEEQVVALVTAVEPEGNGGINVNLLDPESRLDLPGSGQYAALRTADGRLLWSSPSLVGTGLVLGRRMNVGDSDLRDVRASDGSMVAEFSRGLQWEYGAGQNRKLVFTVAQSTATQMRELWRFRRQMTGWFTALALSSLAAMTFFLRRSLSPLRRLGHEITNVENGTALRLGGGYPRELAGVARDLNALLESERNRIERYRDTLGNLAHSLKTPLAVIRASIGTAEGPAAIQLEVDRMAQIVEHQLKRAAASGGATLGQAPEPILPLVTELRATMLKVHARKDLRLEIDVAPELGFLGDRSDILELLGNLLDNACKWCQARVLVRANLDPARPSAQRLAIVVEDDGAGIAPSDRRRVIERGARADEHVPGHGLGLAMVRETAALYGGKLNIDVSPNLGGARVELLLPGR